MKNKFLYLIGFLIIFSFLLIACSTNSSSSKEYKTIETDLYKLSIPTSIEAEKIAGSALLFRRAKKNIGGLDILGYNPDQPLSQLEPNHSKVLLSEKLQGFSYEVWQENLELTQPAASGDKSIIAQTHIYFVFKDKKIAFDLYFYTKEIAENTLLDIAGSFKLKN